MASLYSMINELVSMGLTYLPFYIGYGVRAVAKFCLSCWILKIDINEYIKEKGIDRTKVQFQSYVGGKS